MDSLYNDALFAIIRHADRKTIIRLSLTNKRFYELFKNIREDIKNNVLLIRSMKKRSKKHYIKLAQLCKCRRRK